MKEKKLIPERRRSKIIELLDINDSISIFNLAEEFKVSIITIRRDLELLESKGLINKIYGGITKKTDKVLEIHFLKQLNKMRKEKSRIAIECAKRIEDGFTILLHGGTTCFEIAKKLSNKKNLKIITCSPSIIDYLWKEIINRKNSHQIYCPGGELQITSNFFTGRHSESFFKDISIDIAFIGVIALDTSNGYMVTAEREGLLVKEIISASDITIAPTDHSKFNKKTFIKTDILNSIDEIITDRGLSDKIYDKFIENKIKVTRV